MIGRQRSRRRRRGDVGCRRAVPQRRGAALRCRWCGRFAVVVGVAASPRRGRICAVERIGEAAGA